MATLTREELEDIIGVGSGSGILGALPDRLTPRSADGNRIIAELQARGEQARAESDARAKRSKARIKKLEAEAEAKKNRPKPKAGSTAAGKEDIADLFKGIPGVTDMVKDIIGSF
jgi:hypothetical protein